MAGNEEVVETLSLKIKVEYSGNKKLQDFGNTVKDLIPNVERLAKSLTPLLNGLNSIGKTSGGISKVIDSLRTEAKDMSSAQKQVAEANKKIAESNKTELKDPERDPSKDTYTDITDYKKVNKMLKQAEKLKKIKGIFTGLIRSIGRIALYRAIRSAIKAVTQAFSEGTQNAYQWSKSVNGEFAKSMDSIATSMEYLKNSIGAALIPMIEAFEPVIESLVDKIVLLINTVNRFVSAATGSKTWTEAVKKNVQYAKSVDKVKRSLLGFDEINQLQDEDSTTDVTKSYEFIERKLDSQDLATKMGTIINKVKAKLSDFGDYWKTIVAKVKGSDIYKNLETGFKNFKKWIGNFKKALEDPDSSISRFIENCKLVAYNIGLIISRLIAGTSSISGFVDLIVQSIGLNFDYIVDQFNNCCDLLTALANKDWAGVWEAVKSIFIRFVEWILQKILFLGKAIGTVLDLLNMDVFGWKDIDIHQWDLTVDGKLPDLETPENNYKGGSTTHTNGSALAMPTSGIDTNAVGSVYLDGKELYNSYIKYSKSSMRQHGGAGGGF